MSISRAMEVISGINECVNFFQWARSTISSLRSQWNGAQDQKLEDVLQLQSDLQCLRDTLPAMYDLIDRAEWRSHEDCVAELLPKLQDAVYDADDLLDEFRWYEQKLEVEGSVSQSPFTDFFNSVIQGSFNKVKDIQKRLNNLSNQLEKMGLREVTPRFDKSVRPETSSFPNEAEIFGRDKELNQVLGLLLGVPTTSSGAHSKRKRASSCGILGLPVLPIVGIGGVGKTTLAQHICNHPQVKSHFNLIIWICVSDDFDVKRLTQEAIQSACGKKATPDHLDSLQHALVDEVKNKRLLLILDDMWDDSLKEHMQCWNTFCAPLTHGLPGSVMLLTTRSPEVADAVRTMEPIPLEGLKEDVFWDFFKQCVFGSDCSNNNPELESIGRSILPKLKGSPLAAKTLGRLLRMQLHPTHWNNVLKSELWELKQKETDVLPALRLSYIYLPFHLKRCFSFCAVYPKDHIFEKDRLSEIWVAEGFVEAEGDIPIRHIGCQYFEELVNRSFFQKIRGRYVIHDLLHDMAQLVSRHDCFIIKDTSDFQKVPQNVRHLSILSSTKVDCSDLRSLSKHTKLRTLLCYNYLWDTTLTYVMHCWCSEFRRMRVFFCASTNKLPDSIGLLKHLRYLEISQDCPFKTLPSAFGCLYNLQILHASNCRLESLPNDFGKLLNLQVLELPGFLYLSKGQSRLDATICQGAGFRSLKNMNQICGGLSIYKLDEISKDDAVEFELKNKKYIDRLMLEWSTCWGRERNPEGNEKEVLQVLQPPTSLKSLELLGYPCESLPSWFQPRNLPSITSLTFRYCHGFEGTSFSGISQRTDLNEITGVLVDNNDGSIFSSLTDLTFHECQNLSSLEQFLQHVPAVKSITIEDCGRLVSLPTTGFSDLHCLEELEIGYCPNLDWRNGLVLPSSLRSLSLQHCGDISACFPSGLVLPSSFRSLSLAHCGDISACFPSGLVLPSSLERLYLNGSGDISACFPSCLESLTSLVSLKMISCAGVATIPRHLWTSNLASLQELFLWNCPDLVSIGGAEAIAKIENVSIHECPKLMQPRQPVRRGGI